MEKQLNSEEDHQLALRQVDLVFDAKPGTVEGKELERLVGLIEEYENKHYPIEPPKSRR